MTGETATTSIDRVRAALSASGLDLEVKEFPSSTRTAQEAADSIGCHVAQIVKSLIFRGMNTNKPVLALVSGTNRVDEALIAASAGEPIGKANADFVREHTGFAIGGVAPVGHLHPVLTLVDRDLEEHSEIWAAAGKPNAVFRLSPDELKQLTGGTVIRVC